jgi:DNA-binding NarL/FixJ family response regulator
MTAVPERAMQQARVLIADDHAVVLDRLVTLLKDRFEVVGTVSDGNVLIERATRLSPDVIVLDLSMPGFTGLEALRQLRLARSEAKIIVLTMDVDAEIVTEAISCGASGFLLKLLAGEQLATAIDEVLQGRVYVARG